MTAKLRRVIIAAKFNPQKSMPSAWPGKTPKISPPKPRNSSEFYLHELPSARWRRRLRWLQSRYTDWSSVASSMALASWLRDVIPSFGNSR
jgi:hypothetical protein